MKPIDKVAWIYIRDRKILGVRSKGKDTPFTPGGKREGAESDVETLTREISEELSVELVPETIAYINTFTAQAYGKPEGVLVEIKCYSAEHRGELVPGGEIEALEWVSTADLPRLGKLFQIILTWFKERDRID